MTPATPYSYTCWNVRKIQYRLDCVHIVPRYWPAQFELYNNIIIANILNNS